VVIAAVVLAYICAVDKRMKNPFYRPRSNSVLKTASAAAMIFADAW
jgi:hypothetical protein